MEKDTPKYILLVTWIKEKIAEDKLVSGDKFYTENELSTLFNISRQTVRQAINVLKEENVLEAHQGSGTFIANKHSSKKKTTKTIGVITTFFDDYIFPSIIKGIETVLVDNGYSIQFACTYNNIENEARAINSMLSKNVDAFIIEPTKSALPISNKKCYDEIANRKIPLLFFNAFYPEMNVPYVALDDVEAGRIAAQYLIDCGHTKIAAALKSDDIQGILRYKGIVSALNKAGIEHFSENIYWFTTEDVQYIGDDFSRMIRYINDSTAMICYNDKIAHAVMLALRQKNISIPGQLSIISIDNSDLASVCDPPLTSVAHPKKQLGVTAAENILKMLKTQGMDTTVKFTPTLVTRDSASKI